MSIRIFFLVASLLMVRCGNPSSNALEQNENEADSTSTNQVLYDQVMDIHDEVMPKMQDLYSLKKGLQDKIAATPNISAEEKQVLEKRIVVLDSVSQLMLDWMHTMSKFDLKSDSTDQEAAREYLESELEKIRKVREAMLETIASEKESK